MRFFAEFIKSFLAGIAIAIGGSVFLSADNKYVGAVLFSVGLIAVVFFNLSLFTGRIGYVLENDKKYFGYTALSVIGNMIGCLAVALIKQPLGNVADIVAAKLEKPPLALFLDALFCGILIYICVEIYKKRGTYIGIFVCIPTFILCGFEHSVADSFYIFGARAFTPQVIAFLLIVVLGNAAGGLLIPAALKLKDRLEKA